MDRKPVLKRAVACFDIVECGIEVVVEIEIAVQSAEGHEAATVMFVCCLLVVLIQSSKTSLVQAPVFAWLCCYNTHLVEQVVARAARRVSAGNSWTRILSELGASEE
jgi:hypothetical protein